MGWLFGLLGFIDVELVLDAFLAIYLIMGSIGIGYFFLRTGFKKSDSIHKEYRVGWSVVFGLSYSSVVIVFSLGASFFAIAGMGFSEFILIFSGLVFAAATALLKVRSVVLPAPKIVQKQAPSPKKENTAHEQIIEFDNPKQKPLEVIEAKKTVQAPEKKEGTVFGVNLFGAKPKPVTQTVEKSPAVKPSPTMIDLLESSKKKQEEKKVFAPIVEKNLPQEKPIQKEREVSGKFAYPPEKTQQEKGVHPFSIFKKDLPKPREEQVAMVPKPVEAVKQTPLPPKPVKPVPAEPKLLSAPQKKPDLKSIIPQKPKVSLPSKEPPKPSVVQKSAAPVTPLKPLPLKKIVEKKEFSPLPEDKADYFGLKEKEEEKKTPAMSDIPGETETPLQKLLREKREKILKLRKGKGDN